jgi:excisionase family DNA binding protein
MTQAETPKTPMFVSVKEACALISINERMFRRYIRSNTGPRYKRWGRLIRIRYTELMKWADENHKTPPKGY